MGETLRKFCLCNSKKTNNEIKVFNVLLLGLSGSGKTEVGHAIVGEIRKDFAVTNGVRRFNKNSENILWNITEIGGSLDMQRIWHHYFIKTMAIIFTINISEISKLPNAFAKLHQIVQNSFIQGKPVLIILTQSDLADINVVELEDFFSLESLANNYKSPMMLQEYGKDDKTRLNEGMIWLKKKLEENYKSLKNRIKFETNLENPPRLSPWRKTKDKFRRPNSAPSRANRINANKSAPRLRLRRIFVESEKDVIKDCQIENVENKNKDTSSPATQIKEIFGQEVNVFRSNRVGDINNGTIVAAEI